MMSSCSEKKTLYDGEMRSDAVHNSKLGEEVTVMKEMSFGEHLDMYRKFFFEKGERTPSLPLPQVGTNLGEIIGGGRGELKATWLGHSSLLINIDGFIILTDPVFERKVSIVGPTRFQAELPVRVEALKFVDIVLISHDHYDHLNKYSIKKLADKTDVFIVPLRVGARLIDWGIPGDKIIELDWWEESFPRNGLKIAATPAKHFSGRGLFDRNKTLWASWVIRSETHSVFFSGDTGYFDGFRKIGEKYGPFDITFLECGAYNEKWSDIHMFPEQTALAFRDLRGKILQPIHWGTFNLAMHSWYEPIVRLTKETQRRNIPLSTPIMGQVVDYEVPAEHIQWWELEIKDLQLTGGLDQNHPEFSEKLSQARN